MRVVKTRAVKDKDSPLERMFADFGATPFSKTVPVINGGVEVQSAQDSSWTRRMGAVGTDNVSPLCKLTKQSKKV